MAGNREHVDHAAAQIDAAGLFGPFAMPKAFCSASTVAGISVVLGMPSKPLSPAV